MISSVNVTTMNVMASSKKVSNAVYFFSTFDFGF